MPRAPPTVFAPSLLRGEDDGLDILKIRAQCQVIENCILYHAVVFQEEGEEDVDGDEDEDAEEAAVVEGVDACLLAAAAPSVDYLNTDGPTMPHDFKKSAFNPVSCQHCHKAILGLGQAYQCHGTSTKAPSVGVASGFRFSHANPPGTQGATSRCTGSAKNTRARPARPARGANRPPAACPCPSPTGTAQVSQHSRQTSVVM